MKQKHLLSIAPLFALVISGSALSAGGIVMDTYGSPVTTPSGDCVYWGDYTPNECPNNTAVIVQPEPTAMAQPEATVMTQPEPTVEPKAKKIISLDGVTFKTGSDELTTSSLAKLNGSAQELINNSSTKVVVAGHTDNRGDTLNNLSLSQARAETVRNYLVEQGVKEKQLTARGYGDTEPTASNESAEGRAQNRRVELRIY